MAESLESTVTATASVVPSESLRDRVRGARAPKRPTPGRSTIPRSNNAVAQVTRWQPVDYKDAGAETVQVRCGCCEHRLFDVATIVVKYWDEDAQDYIWAKSTALQLETSCPMCHLKVAQMTTATPGTPLPDGSGLDGAWYCARGCRSLGHVDPIRGRIRTTCRRCNTVVHVTAADAIQIAQVEVPF